MRTSSLAYLSLSWLVLACSSAPANQYRPPPPPPPAIDSAVTYQVIEGFGASSAWYTPRLTDAQAEMFFSVDKGLGLTLLRAHINPDGTTGELVTAQQAAALGVKVWAAPW